MAALLPATDNVASEEGANMGTDPAPWDGIGTADLAEASVVRDLRMLQPTRSGDTQRLILVLAVDCPRFTVVALSAKSSRLIGAHTQDPRGHALAEVLWLTPPGDQGLDAVAVAASLGRVMHTGKPESMPLRMCHITQGSRGEPEALRLWSLISFPMLGADGRVNHIVLRIEDVTLTSQIQLAHDVWLPAAPRAPAAPATITFGSLSPVSECPQHDSAPGMTLGPAASVPRALRAIDQDTPSLLWIAPSDAEGERLRMSFADLGYRVLWAGSERDALAICAQEHPDCILLDLSSPDSGGLRTCRAIRDLTACAEAAIICLSARCDTASLDSALLAGADEVLEKPIKPQQLLSHVQTALLQQPGMTDSLRAHCQALRQQRLRICRLQLHRERAASYIVHDLKEPLSTIDLRAALLLVDPALAEPARSSIERIRTQVRSALLQVLNLLDIRMLDEGRLEARYEAVDLFRLVRELLADFDTKAQARALTLRSDIEVPQITADPDLIRRVLANLVDNAVRHAPNSSVVAVTAHRIGGARVELRVVDMGASIPAEMTKSIFEPYVQIEQSGAAYRHRTGRGLGLAFCKLAVEAHRGEISVSSIDKRTVFSIKLPETYKHITG